MQPFWLAAWTLCLSLAWLNPHHTRPWNAFHTDAWMGFVVALAAFALAWRARTTVKWQVLPCVAAGAAWIPWVQHAFGLLPYSGEAWTTSAYLIGFLGTLLIGSIWEQRRPAQLADTLFVAISLACVLSVVLQLLTWLQVVELHVTDSWSMGLRGSRPYANLGQPNQLATLFIWGVIAAFWFHARGRLGGVGACTLGAWFLMGAALTQSRTGTLEVFLLVGMVWVWRRHWPSRIHLPWKALALGLFHLACFPLLALINDATNPGSELRAMGDAKSKRTVGWQILAEAVSERPWFGYGWSDLGRAQVAAIDHFPPFGEVYSRAHNLFLDLIASNGLPIGLALSGVLCWWLWRSARRVSNAQDALLVLALLCIGVHAMLEFPLHYAYFLLPTGLIMGMLDVRIGARVLAVTPARTAIAVWALGAVMLAVTIRDYLRVEESFLALRFEEVGVAPPDALLAGPPDVWVLNDFENWIRWARGKAMRGMTAQELSDMEATTALYPSGGGMYRMALAFALNGQPERARMWLGRIDRLMSVREGAELRSEWIQRASSTAEVAAVPWPTR